MSHRNFLCQPDDPPRFPSLPETELGANCAGPRSGSWFGRMAEHSPHTDNTNWLLRPVMNLSVWRSVRTRVNRNQREETLKMIVNRLWKLVDGTCSFSVVKFALKHSRTNFLDRLGASESSTTRSTSGTARATSWTRANGRDPPMLCPKGSFSTATDFLLKKFVLSGERGLTMSFTQVTPRRRSTFWP